MVVKLLEVDGINQIKASMKEEKDQLDSWCLILLDCTSVNKHLNAEDVAQWIAEKMPHLNGMITQSSTDMVTFLLEVKDTSNINDTLHEINSFLPPEFMCRVTNQQQVPGEVKKVTSIIDYADKQTLATPNVASQSSNAQDEAPAEAPIKNELFKKKSDRLEKRVLIADDDIFMRQLLTTSLEKDFKTFTVENGKDVLSAYQEHLPDVLLLDIHFPDTSGLEVIDEVMEYDPDAYIVMLSADSIRKNVNIAVERGAKGFVTKPPQKDKLYEYIERCPTYKQGKKTEASHA